MRVERPFGNGLIFDLNLDHVDFAAGNDDTIEVIFIRGFTLKMNVFFARKWSDPVGLLEDFSAIHRRRSAIDSGWCELKDKVKERRQQEKMFSYWSWYITRTECRPGEDEWLLRYSYHSFDDTHWRFVSIVNCYGHNEWNETSLYIERLFSTYLREHSSRRNFSSSDRHRAPISIIARASRLMICSSRPMSSDRFVWNNVRKIRFDGLDRSLIISFSSAVRNTGIEGKRDRWNQTARRAHIADRSLWPFSDVSVTVWSRFRAEPFHRLSVLSVYVSTRSSRAAPRKITIFSTVCLNYDW